MRNSILKTIGLIIIVCLLTSAVVLAQGQKDSPIPAQIYSVGMLQDDGSVLYSVVFYSGPDALDTLAITSAVPEKAAFDAVVIAPSAAHLAPDSSNSILKWTLDKVAAQTVIGPFTYRVKFGSGDKQIPANVGAQVSWFAPAKGTIDAKIVDETLKPLDKTGKITIDPQGTVNDKGEPIPVQVGNTGIWIFVPKGAVAQSIELTFTRLTINDSSVPANVKDTWWCTLVGIEANPTTDLINPVLIGLPTRQVLTVGMGAQAFVKNGDEKWQSLPTVQALRIAGNGNLAEVMFAGQIPQLLAVGVKSDDRQNGSVGVPASTKGFQLGQGGFQSAGSFQFGGFQIGGFQGFQGAQFGGNCGFNFGSQGGC